ncbi:cell division control protein 48 homolog C [Selaginella moellendorffii]|uniref:cell division control protein 48 homolog C n=1 Tax=Selaginella moellendorffii TaxID=88036 RepID=UPI000D1C3978|nr:cell division control protein 48 homolog C [Selaginella moellendorffii]|eukprot:XP_002975982.2 cell division control protein 48 homolog C [Selaginella moellendorffii]
MAGGRGSAYFVDPLLLPRIEQYAHNNNINHIDNTVDYLRRSYREYQRKQLLPFRKSVEQAVRIVNQSGESSEESEGEEAAASSQKSSQNHRPMIFLDTPVSGGVSGPLTVARTPNSRKREREKEEENADKKRSSVVPPEKKDGRQPKFAGATMPQNVSFKDFGGLGDAMDVIVEFIFPVVNPDVVDAVGMEHMKALLLHGPPGCGKSLLAEAIANEASVPFFKVSAPEVVSGTSGESEAKLRTLFSEAFRVAPAIIFIDEVDAICSKRESAQREMERRIVTQLMVCMDEIDYAPRGSESEGGDSNKLRRLLVIAATNRPEALDQALRRRFDREICLKVPDEKARLQILTVLASKLRLDGEFDFKAIARRTPGFVGADLKVLTKEAGVAAIRRIAAKRKAAPAENEAENVWWRRAWTPEELQELRVTMDDFEVAIKKVVPSTKREGFTEIPNVSWEDVGALETVREELEFLICSRVKHPEDYETLNFSDSGFLLYGPPGCGKTLVAKAVANAAGANFIYIKAGELFNKYVGESERAVRQLFSRARDCSPCLIFFDEIDALAPGRGSEANAATDRVVNQLLVEMDGLEQRKCVFVIGATNRPNMIDTALLRPGRLGKRIYIPLPDAQGRESILRALLRCLPLAADVDMAAIAQHELCEGFTGADLHGLVQEACGVALRERIPLWRASNGQAPQSGVTLTQKHFAEALNRVEPSVSAGDYSKNFPSSSQAESPKTKRRKKKKTTKGTVRLVTHC